MPAEHLLALDAGTSAARCVIARAGEGVVALARREWQYETPPEIAPFGRSFDAGDFWTIICELVREALAGAGLSGRDIAAVGITSQRLALVIIDGDGRALYAGPNIDVRALAEGFAIDARLSERVYASTGKLPSLLLAPARLHWLRKHDPAGFERAAAALTLGDWVAYRLTGEMRGERSLAEDCGLLNVTTRERDPALMRELDLPARLLPPLVSPGEVAGVVAGGPAKATGLAEGTPVTIAGSDTQCALLGMGVLEPGEIGIVAGWSCPVQQVTTEARLDAGRRTWACLHVLPERWAVESSAADAGRAWRWWSETILGERPDALDEAASLAAQAPPGSGDVLALFVPAPMNAGAMGVHLGGVLMTTPLAAGAVGRPQLLRAALENVALAFRANVEQAEEISGLPATRVVLGGGFTRAAVFPSILAGVLARPIEVADEAETSALGALMLAAEAAGLPAARLASPTGRIEPDPASVETYRRQYERWRRLAGALDQTMKELP